MSTSDQRSAPRKAIARAISVPLPLNQHRCGSDQFSRELARGSDSASKLAAKQVQTVPLPPVRTWRGQQVADYFELPTSNQPIGAMEPLQSLSNPQNGQVMLICGASGSGKSSLLRRIVAYEELIGRRVIDLARLVLPDAPAIDCLPDLPLEAALSLLGRMGLGEAWTYLRTPLELSDGQRWRLRLAVAIHEFGREPARPATLICDEFAALLDRVTAAIVSRATRRVIDTHPNLAAVVATSHDDVAAPLKPNRIVRCDFGQFTSEEF